MNKNEENNLVEYIGINEEKNELTKEFFSKYDKQETISKKEISYKLLYSYKTIIIIVLFIILGASKIETDKKDPNVIKVAFFCNCIKYGGIERVVALLVSLLSREKNFIIFLITSSKILENEYYIPNNVKRISLSEQKINIFQFNIREKLDIIVYNFYDKKVLRKLNTLKNTKIIAYDHSCFVYWIYYNQYKFEDTMYKAYKDCKYVISLIPLENDYLFKIWGINSILMDNPLTFEYDSILPSDLSDKNIIMIGRGSDRLKRFELGIESMKYIIKEIPECIMNIISESVEEQEKLIKTLNLEKNIKFTGFQSNIDTYLKNTSLHIFPSIAEGYPMVLGETKMYGIPTILCGLDYLALAKGGTVMVYDDNPETIAKEAIKILKNETYRKILGDEARKSMEKRKNEFIEQRWAKLLSLVHKGDDESILKLNENKMTDKEAEEILINQLKMIHLRRPNLKDVTLDQLKSYELV